MIKKILFWQPKKDYLRLLSASSPGKKLLIFLNYAIWFYLFYVSYQLIRQDIQIFGRLFIATVFGEIIERLVKGKVYWRRPMFVRHDKTPTGLVDGWYQTGSFPSGHSIKVAYFALFIIQTGFLPLPQFLVICLPLLTFRVIVGFHYPVDTFGGFAIGWLLWYLTQQIVMFPQLTYLIQNIFNFIFIIKT